MKIIFPELAKNSIAQEAVKSFDTIEFFDAPDLETAVKMLADKKADSMISGLDYSSRDVLLAYKAHIPLKSPYFSSCFICQKGDQILALADGGVNKIPTKEQLYTIVEDTARTFENYTGTTPIIAMLSYSTNGSGGKNPDLEKIYHIIEKIRENHSDWLIDGEMQLDAAINPRVGEKKFPGSKVAGHANILITPDLNSGNILYKSLEQFGGFTIAGPIIQGFTIPLADLSRGSTAEDVSLTIDVIKKTTRKDLKMKYFGTDGIRQPADKFTPDFLTKIIKGLTDYAGTDIKVLLGGDTRESSEWILSDLESACETFGIEYGNVGVLPTPAINYCFYEMGFDFAIDVTASHNPYTDNGIKIFERGANSGQKLYSAGCEAIERALDQEEPIDLIPSTLRENLHDEAVTLYKEHLLNYLEIADFSGLHLGMDCANGATSVINKQIFEQLGAKVELIHAGSSYGQGINHDCGSTHLDSLKELVTTHHLDFGIAFDGDGDRCLMIDQNGDEVDGDEIIAILANYLNLDQIAITVMANQGLLNWAKDSGIHAEITAVGDSNVAQAMRTHHIKIGGEQSGHIILPNEATGDGMLTSLMITKVIAETKKPLDNLARIITKFPQVIVNLEATPEQKQNLKNSSAAKQLLLDYSKKLEQVSGRLLVRPSGTEPLIRITMWGNDKAKITTLAEELKNKLGETI